MVLGHLRQNQYFYPKNAVRRVLSSKLFCRDFTLIYSGVMGNFQLYHFFKFIISNTPLQISDTQSHIPNIPSQITNTLDPIPDISPQISPKIENTTGMKYICEPSGPRQD